jgi:hypothetical protein
MKHVFLFISIALVWGASAFGETYYCTPVHVTEELVPKGTHICSPVDFEHRTFVMDPNRPVAKSFRCYGKGDAYKCVPFDNGAILLETPHRCPERGGIHRFDYMLNTTNPDIFIHQ